MAEYYRDESTGALINKDDSHYQAILAERQARRNYEEITDRLTAVEKQVEALRMMFFANNGNK